MQQFARYAKFAIGGLSLIASIARDFGKMFQQYNRVQAYDMRFTSVVTTLVPRYGHVDDYRYGVISKLTCGGGAYLSFAVGSAVEC